MTCVISGNYGCFPVCQRFQKFWSEFKCKGLFRFLPTEIFSITSQGGPLILVRIFWPKFSVPFFTNQFFFLRLNLLNFFFLQCTNKVKHKVRIQKKNGRYYFQHPYARLFVAYFVIFCNFFIYAEDPVSHSRANCTIPLVGNDFAFVTYRYRMSIFYTYFKVKYPQNQCTRSLLTWHSIKLTPDQHVACQSV